MKNFFSPLHRLLAMDALFEGGRMFVGATSVAFLIQNKLSLADIALLKTIQSIVIILAEIPTGAYADTAGRKKSLLLAVLFGTTGFSLFYLGKTLPIFILAELFTALALCFWSGAYEALAIESNKLENQPEKMSRFFHLNQALNSFTVLVFGGIGGWLGSSGLNIPYLGAIAVFLMLSILIFPVQENRFIERKLKENPINFLLDMKKNLHTSVNHGILHPLLLPFVLANIGIQFVIQPLLHFWQPFLQSFSSEVGPSQLGIAFSSYCAFSAVAGLMYSRLSQFTWTRGYSATLFLCLTFSGLYYCLGYVSKWQVALVLFVFIQGVLSITRTSINIQMNALIPSSSRASILSSLSLISRIGSVSALWVIPLLGNASSSNATTTPLSMIRTSSIGSIIILVTFLSIKIFARYLKKLNCKYNTPYSVHR